MQIIIILALILANGLFSMSEMAIVSARKTRLQQMAEDDPGARKALELAEKPERFLSTVQIGITLIGTLSGAVGGATLSVFLAKALAQVPVLQPVADGLALFLVVLLISYTTLVFGELMPKRIALNNPEDIARRISRLMNTLAVVSRPVEWLLTASTNLGMRILRVRPSSDPPVTEDEVRVLLEQGTRVGVFEEVEQDIIESVFRMSDRRVDVVMTPRTDIFWIDLDEPYDENLRRVIISSHSMIPAAHGSLDQVLGILHARELLAALVGEDRVVDLERILHPSLFVPESTPAFRVLDMLRKTGEKLALVVDEYGGVQGMVTLYDLMEAIVGDFPDTGAEGNGQMIRREDGSWLLDGLLPIDELKDLLDLDDLPGEDRVGYQTLGGFVMSQLGAVPSAGEAFEWSGMRFEVVDMDGRRVDKIIVAPVKA